MIQLVMVDLESLQEQPLFLVLEGMLMFIFAMDFIRCSMLLLTKKELGLQC